MNALIEEQFIATHHFQAIGFGIRLEQCLDRRVDRIEDPCSTRQKAPRNRCSRVADHADRRAVQYANGWYGFALDLTKTAECLNGLKKAAQEVNRPKALGELEISITPGPTLDLDTVKRYADLGVHRVIPFPRAKTEQVVQDFIKQSADTLIGRV